MTSSNILQVIVLSRVIPDEEQAVISAAGIKLISDILHESRSPVIQALAADCIARLAHTRAGMLFNVINDEIRLWSTIQSSDTLKAASYD